MSPKKNSTLAKWSVMLLEKKYTLPNKNTMSAKKNSTLARWSVMLLGKTLQLVKTRCYFNEKIYGVIAQQV
jgi:hypothetical protein